MSTRRSLPWGEIVRLAILVLVVVLPRVLFLDADPPGDLHIHFITDEGWWAHNARQQALFGHWIMDDHNPPLWSTPAYSFLLWMVYQVLGVGLYQTRLLSGVAGAITCFAVYGFVRREATPRVAFVSALVLAAGYFLLSNNRVAFTESVQLAFAVTAILAALRSRADPGWAVVSAAGLLLALMCKPSAIPVGLVIAALYGTMLVESRGRPQEHAVCWRAALVFVASATAGAAALAFFFLVPHGRAILSEFRSNTLIATNPDLPTGGGIRPLLWYGFREEPGGPSVMNGFFAQEVALVVSVALLAVSRLLGRGRRLIGNLERCCWWWIVVTLAFLSIQTYHPDRRYLLLVPPFAMLLGLAAGGTSATLRPAESPAPRLRAWRWLAAWGVLGLVLGLYLRAWLLPMLTWMTARVSVGADRGVSQTTLLMLVWVGSFLLAAAALLIWGRWGALRRGAIPGVLLLAAVLTGDVARDAVYWSHLRFSIRDVSREIGRLAESLPLDRRSAVGNTSDTLTLENHLFAFVIRDWGFARMYMNLDGFRRFRPGLALVTERHGKPVGGDEGFSVAGMRVVRVFDYWPDAGGHPRLRTTVYAPDIAAR
jgi:4-amino-4-deoxy-L-arabinose transferase-like glycosyltransferase